MRQLDWEIWVVATAQQIMTAQRTMQLLELGLGPATTSFKRDVQKSILTER
jgi:hypothetical protein